MIEFEVTGFTKGTRRRRHRVIAAKSETAARAIAESRNIEITSIQRVPEEYASGAQLNYALALGISCPADATKDELSALIQLHLDNAEDPLDLLIDLARRQRVARITYWKYGEPSATVRLVEPYDLVGNYGEARAVHCYQIDPHPIDGVPWRTFNLVKIKSVLDAGNSFYPRRLGTLLTGELVTYESVNGQRDNIEKPNNNDIKWPKVSVRKAAKPKIRFGTVLLFSVLTVVVLWVLGMILQRWRDGV
jgi:hypothetical protein